MPATRSVQTELSVSSIASWHVLCAIQASPSTDVLKVQVSSRPWHAQIPLCTPWLRMGISNTVFFLLEIKPYEDTRCIKNLRLCLELGEQQGDPHLKQLPHDGKVPEPPPRSTQCSCSSKFLVPWLVRTVHIMLPAALRDAREPLLTCY